MRAKEAEKRALVILQQAQEELKKAEALRLELEKTEKKGREKE